MFTPSDPFTISPKFVGQIFDYRTRLPKEIKRTSAQRLPVIDELCTDNVDKIVIDL